jgi:hypothetical protein
VNSETTPPGVVEYDTPDGFHVLRVHYTADPAKRSEDWKKKEQQGTSAADWEQEMEINFNVPKGLPWYPEFRYDFHVAKAPLVPVEGRPILRGWDYGLTPATVFCQTTAKGQVLVLYPELQSWESGILSHGRVAQSESATYFPGYRFMDWGDPAGNQRAQTDEKTCVQVLREEFGINVNSGPVAAAQRDLPIRKALTTITQDGQPMLLIDPRCTWLIAALTGGYQRKEVAGRVTDELADNEYTHIVDALGYVVSMTGRAEEPKTAKGPRLGRM